MDVVLNICPICAEDKNPAMARFEHVPGSCIPCTVRVSEVALVLALVLVLVRESRASSWVQPITADITNALDNMTVESLPHPSVNMVTFSAVSQRPVREVEERMHTPLARIMFEKMESGLFPDATTPEIREAECTWWTGSVMNAKAKVRKRSNNEAVVKVTRGRTRIVPVYILAVSDGYGFDGAIKSVMYDVDMVEIRSTMMIRNTTTHVIARRYTNDIEESYAAEFEIEGRATNSIVKAIVCTCMGIVGTIWSMRGAVDPEFRSDNRAADHIVMDVSSLKGYKGEYMAKADGMKVYILYYTFSTGMPELTIRPDVVVAEMIADGSMVYIDTLSMNGSAKLSVDLKRHKCALTTRRPYMICRKGFRSPHQAPGRVLCHQIEQHGTTATMLLLLTLSREGGPGRQGVGGRADVGVLGGVGAGVADSVHVAEQIPGHVRERDVELFDVRGLPPCLVKVLLCGHCAARCGSMDGDMVKLGMTNLMPDMTRHRFPIHHDTEDNPGNIITFV
ncbi:hypothetical protein AYO21_09137 [Fonsecaea monophora]|uniref:Uncharacterized protein n=1 Tax=Fonsecaea monophora TaxID=254056 RepID=A0A177F030_9EURO|nr:hypothetical protein AYO21_09137 [Fonsecaea monophora]OAG36662.1 hypothetical protein AYO21_09137 [Fonsecaea monophora]